MWMQLGPAPLACQSQTVSRYEHSEPDKVTFSVSIVVVWDASRFYSSTHEVTTRRTCDVTMAKRAATRCGMREAHNHGWINCEVIRRQILLHLNILAWDL